MKPNIIWTAVACGGILASISSCTNQNPLSPSDLSTGKDVKKIQSASIKRVGDSESFSAKVTTYQSSDRKLNQNGLFSRLKISSSIINDEIYMRIDKAAIGSSPAHRVVMSKNTTLVAQDGKTPIRMSSPKEDPTHRLIFPNKRLIICGKVGSIDDLKARAIGLSCDIISHETNELNISVPPSLFGEDSSKISKKNLFFDVVNQTYTGSTTVYHEENGEIITVRLENIYAEFEGEQVRVGSITEIEHVFISKLDTTGYSLPIINSEESIKEVSKVEFDSKVKSGEYIVVDTDPIIGDPSDRSYKEYFYEFFEEIELGSVDSTLFREIL